MHQGSWDSILREDALGVPDMIFKPGHMKSFPFQPIAKERGIESVETEVRAIVFDLSHCR